MLQGYMSNFIKPEVINNSTGDHDITKIKYFEQKNQIKMVNLVLVHLQGFFCTNLKMKLLEHQLSINFYPVLCETSIKKMLDKFPFEDSHQRTSIS